MAVKLHVMFFLFVLKISSVKNKIFNLVWNFVFKGKYIRQEYLSEWDLPRDNFSMWHFNNNYFSAKREEMQIKPVLIFTIWFHI